MPVSKNVAAGDLENWVKQQGLKDIKAASWKDMGTGKSQTLQYGSFYITNVQDENGKELIAMYVGYLRGDKSVRSAKIFYPPTEAKSGNVRIAAQHFGALAKNEQQTNTPANTNTQNEKTDTKNNSNIASNTLTIKGIVMHSESTIGVGGLIGTVSRPYVFFSDGSFYGVLDTDPYNLSHRNNLDKWGHWRMKGKTIAISWDQDGKTDDWESYKWRWALPATKGEKIAGTFSAISGGGNSASGGSSYTMSSKYITFNRNGQFTFESVGGGGYSGVGGDNSAWSSSNNAGTYVLDRYGIELHFNNGKTVRSGFSFYDDKKDMMSIGSSIYSKSE